MKLLKAYIRTSLVDRVIRSLEEAAAPGITLSHVHGVGYGYEPMLFTLSPSEYKKTLAVTKLEVVCEDGDAERLVAVIVEAARTGSKGDGIVFVTRVEQAVKVRTGALDAEALQA